jgi:hypothetical protein
MSAISATGSSASYSAITQLLADDLSNAATAGAAPQIGQASSPGSSASTSKAPTDSVDLSDHAKAVLAQAQKDQVAANQLQALVQSNRNSGGAGKNSVGGITQNFDQLTGQTQSQQGNSAGFSLAALVQAKGGLSEGLYAYQKAVDSAHLQSDGTYASWSQTLHDTFFTAPTTPQEVASWYQSDEGQETLSAAQAWPQNDPGLAAALASHSVTFLNASDFPDLNLHNTTTIQDGEGGGSSNTVYTYNHSAAIFSDPTTSYKVLGDGIVLAWKTPTTTATATSS